MNDLLSHLNRKSYEFSEWIKFQKSRVPMPDDLSGVEIYAAMTWTYDRLLSMIRSNPNKSIGNVIEKFISYVDDRSCERTERPVNMFIVAKDEAEWIEDQIISEGGWI